MSYFDDMFEPRLYKTPKLIEHSVSRLRCGVWDSANGPILVRNMSDSHLRNALNLVTRRNAGEFDRVVKEVLSLEIERREDGREK